MKFTNAALCTLLSTVSLYAVAEPVPPGQWLQTSSTTGDCSTCEVKITKITPDILQLTSNNGWIGYAFYSPKEDKYRGAIQWTSGKEDYEKVVMLVEMSYGKKVLTLNAKSTPLSFTSTYKLK